MSTQSNQLNNFEKEQEGAGGSSSRSASGIPELTIREWYEGTKSILKDRTSYKHRLEMMVIVGAEPIFDIGR